jgi:adenylate cyclase
MQDSGIERRLAAVLAADVVGFSRLMELDEERTMSELRRHRREFLEPAVASHKGRFFKLMGDGALAEFGSVVDAVRCAVHIQRGMAERTAESPEDSRIMFRLGLNLGDLIVDGEDFYGEGVNIAARLEGLAPPGGIACSAVVRNQVGNKLDVVFVDKGETRVKNIDQPVHVFFVDLAVPSTRSVTHGGRTVTTDKPSVAVLPFANMSGDPEQEYFADGISEDVINDLGKIAALRVLSRNTSFTYKGKATNLSDAARQLNVRYILEGSVRKSGNQIRVTARLIDGQSDGQIWSERYDRTINDIFAIQDDISCSIVAALKLRLLPDEKQLIEQRGTNNPEAYRLLLLARYYQYSNTVHDTRLALRFAQEAVAAEPGYAEAWALIAASQIALYEMTGAEETGELAATRALELNPDLAIGLATMGRVMCGLGRYEEAFAAHERSLAISPDSYEVNFLLGRTCTELGRAELAIRYHERAAAISETEFLPLALAIQSYNAMGNRDKARDTSRRALARIEAAVLRRPDDTSALFHGASVLADLGERDRSIEWANRAITIAPDEARGLYLLACTFALLNEPETALDYLEKSLKRMQARFLTWVENDSDLDSIRDHPRYLRLIEGMRSAAERPLGQL